MFGLLSSEISLGIIEIGVVVFVALILGQLFTRLKFASSIGYILAGVVLGPLVFNFLVPGHGIAPLFGEIGILLLLFYLGLELSIKKFKESGLAAFILSCVEMATPFALAFLVARFFGFELVDSIIIGAMLTATSTVMVVKFVMDRGIIKEKEPRAGISILVLEDFFAILVLVFISSLAPSAAPLQKTIFDGLLFVIAMFFVISKVSGFLINYLDARGHADKMSLYAIGVGILVAFFGGTLGLTTALGAYFAGFALAETPYGERIKREIGFIREFFILFFFVSFGATVTVPGLSVLWLLLALVVAYVISKLFSYGVFGPIVGLSPESSMKLGMLMIPIGEFSIIIATAAKDIVQDYATLSSLAFLLTIVSTLISPKLYDNGDKIAKFFYSFYPKSFQDFTLRVSKSIGEKFEGIISGTSKSGYSSIERIVLNLVTVFAVFYVSTLFTQQVDLSFLPLLPRQISIGLLLLPVIIWPLYKSIDELRVLVKNSCEETLLKAFPSMQSHSKLTAQSASSVFTGLLLSLIGLVVTLTVYYAEYDLLIVFFPLLYTLVAIMYFSRSVYSLFEHYEVGENLLSMAEGNSAVEPLSREFQEHSKKLSALYQERQEAQEKIQSSLQLGNVAKARLLLLQFKKRERKLLDELVELDVSSGEKAIKQLERINARDYSKLSRFKKENTQTKRALEEYLKQNL
ncbi:cation:proton antiporter [Candidatus Micrarchaeota archaeon]|nr:cation:proton antiporter [Candidatus Micrarchaeota archaeon]